MPPLMPAKLNYRDPATWVATWGGSGLLKPAPGTWGTLGGLPFGILFLVLGGPTVLALAAIALFPIGLWATRRVEAMTGDHDSGFIVVDEVVGIWITLLFAVATPLSVMLAFGLFRAFDALKPWPVSHFDKNVPGAMGVMLDDVAAGLMAGLCLLGLRYVGIA